MSLPSLINIEFPRYLIQYEMLLLHSFRVHFSLIESGSKNSISASHLSHISLHELITLLIESSSHSDSHFLSLPLENRTILLTVLLIRV